MQISLFEMHGIELKEDTSQQNMKFMMNGAITITTLYSVNVEIEDKVTNNNIVIFGLTADEVLRYYKKWRI